MGSFPTKKRDSTARQRDADRKGEDGGGWEATIEKSIARRLLGVIRKSIIQIGRLSRPRCSSRLSTHAQKGTELVMVWVSHTELCHLRCIYKYTHIRTRARSITVGRFGSPGGRKGVSGGAIRISINILSPSPPLVSTGCCHGSGCHRT